MDLESYIQNCFLEIPELKPYGYPWEMISQLPQILDRTMAQLSRTEFVFEGEIARHRSAVIENGVSIKGPAIIGENCLVKAGAYLRDGVFLGKGALIGANGEVKQSVIFNGSRIAHMNYVGNSMVGRDVNLEAGSILANHFNEFKDRTVQTIIRGSLIDTGMLKFGSLLGDGVRVGANSVLNPGTIMEKGGIVGRLVHIDQLNAL